MEDEKVLVVEVVLYVGKKTSTSILSVISYGRHPSSAKVRLGM